MKKHTAIILLFSLPMSLSEGANAASVEHRTLEYSWGDAVVVGKVESTNFESIGNANDLPGRGIIAATIAVSRVIKGAGLPKRIPVTYVAHVYMRSDRQFMLVLSRKDDGSFRIATAQLVSVRPRLATRCE